MIKSFNISDAKTVKDKKTRSFIVIVGIVFMTAIYMILLHLILNCFGVDPSLPLRQMDGGFVLLSLFFMLLALLVLIVILLFALAEIFHRLKV